MKNLKSYIIITLITMLVFGALYPLAMTGLGGLISPEGAEGKPIFKGETLIGYENVGQAFYSDKYFWSRPSAVDYDASSTGGSNYGNQSPDLLEEVQQRTEKLLQNNPGLEKSEIPVELITASGSGLDPHISKTAAMIQINRISEVRGIAKEDLTNLVNKHNEDALLGIFGPKDIVNVLKLNIALDEMSTEVTVENELK
ncbi:potassium-transporting ATPase subunit KdpC [Psychroflexus planctonicus]|uniref:Potassium-transporting ATPase KdpC subunit n=1 Tax=Psychroflexus planctonicus TaxID=1526575 RepID=A0ABQ1SFE0_9FLAO|nr:potassium-transporting ATPase subunit KdpC [Psychroflexus planctonicus]GGE26354.1 potassium-transporting ATPase KdpC subunit [Psychroflexus planctonicus]